MRQDTLETQKKFRQNPQTYTGYITKTNPECYMLYLYLRQRGYVFCQTLFVCLFVSVSAT